ncbi:MULTISPECIES: hypothetical protein [Burkholderia]|uniref:hypothetical protein n=1 Tax=Burkholderia TaxID=32008 RepID=UPI001E48A1B3|nr:MULTISPECIES: hypothetical protein [Burkholderia]
MPIAHAPHEIAIDAQRWIAFPTAQVDDDEVIAIRVHLLKSDRHGGSGMEAGEYCTWLADREQSRPDGVQATGIYVILRSSSYVVVRL